MPGDESPIHPHPDAGDWDPTAGGTAPPPDRLFTALADRQRRYLLWYLLEESPASVAELADVLAGWQLADTTDVGSEEYDRILATLHHSHLPLLDDAGLAEYDREAGTVTASSLAPAVEGVVQFAHRYDVALPER
jgi:DNA-binding transcriptional ArsR family regulator